MSIQGNLTKHEAINLMRKGIKVSHEYFSDHEWMTMNLKGEIVTEEGYTHDPSEFWSFRTMEGWNKGYRKWEDKK